MKFTVRKGVRHFTEKKSKKTHLSNPYTKNRIKVDSLGTIMFNLMKDEGTFDDVMEKLCTMYPDENPDEIREALHGFVRGLEEHNIFEVIDDESDTASKER
ncbi:MAG: PqqD family peptide modification chaperone [Theionarchaea archaeon]|nr:PqqD family peptide modification chaperone [Theionarchaea archaeon]